MNSLQIKTMKRYLLITIALLLIQTSFLSAQTTYQEWYGVAAKAYEEKDYPRFLEASFEANKIRPNHRVLAYNLAAAYALNNQTKQAIKTLSDRAEYYAVVDFGTDEDFASIRELEPYQALLKKIESLRNPVHTSKEVMQIAKQGFHPEGLTYDAQKDRILLGDIRSGQILSYKVDGSEEELVVDLSKLGYWSAMGMAFDPTNPSLLWISTSAMNIFKDYHSGLQGKSAIVSYDVSKGKMVHEFTIAGNHVFGDLIIGKNGYVWTTDSISPAVYKIDPVKQSMTKEFESDKWWSLQGLVFSEDGNTLFIADYISGVYAVDLEKKNISPISDKNTRNRGTDGLYRMGSNLVMLQNGINPQRVTSIEIDENGKAKENTWRVWDNNLEDLNEPTLGAIINGTLYYIANSPWPFYDGVNQKLDEWPDIKIWKTNLK